MSYISFFLLIKTNTVIFTVCKKVFRFVIQRRFQRNTIVHINSVWRFPFPDKSIKNGALMAKFHANDAIKRQVTTAGLHQKRMA